jgi:hypothetical protein
MLLGLSASAIPILLHLIARRQPPTVVFPAVRYLRDTTRQHQRRLRLRNLLLMLIRTALIAALMLAAAGPSIPVSGVPGHVPSAMVIVADNSVSSGAIIDGEAALTSVRRAAHDVLARATPDDALWVMTASGVVRGDRAMLTRLIDSLTPVDTRLDLGRAIIEADGILSGEDRPGEVFLISDLQSSAVSAADTRASLVVVRPDRDVPGNVGVASIETGSQPWQSDGGRLLVAVDGDSGRSVALTVRAGDAPERQTLTSPGAPAVVAVSSLGPGWWPVEVTLDPDELRADDRRVTAVRVAPVAGVAWPAADIHLATAASVLESNGRLRRGTEVTLGTLGPGLSVLLPPSDPAELGALNRALERRGVAWRFGTLVARSETTDSGAVLGRVEVSRRYTLERTTAGLTGVLATVSDEPWMVRDAGVVLIGSRMEPAWTALPLTAAFVPFMDVLVNRIARGEVAVLETAPGDPVLLPDVTSAVIRNGDRIPVEGGASFVATDRGLYFLLEHEDTIGVLVSNTDARESSLTRATDRDIRSLWRPARILGPDQAGAVAFAAGARGDLRGPLLWLAALLALAEVALASVRKRES